MENQDIRAGALCLKYIKLLCTRHVFTWLQVDEIVQTFGGDYKAK